MKKLFLILLASTLFLTACNSDKKTEEKMDDKKDTTMTGTEAREEKNKQVAMAAMQAFDKGDMTAVFADADPAMVDYADGSTPPMPLDSVKIFFSMLKDAIPDYKGSDLEFLADGDKVLVVGEWSGTLKKDLMGIKPTGKPFKFRDVDIFTFNENNKITSHRSITNFAKILMEK